jgi:pimeloyl-ACP methyl ester carboxylesterase
MVLLPVALLGGCSRFVARQITHPGHQTIDRQVEDVLASQGLRREALDTAAGVRMAYWLVPPRAYQVTSRIRRTERDGHLAGIHFGFRFGADDPAHLALLPARGSVLLLHPWGVGGMAMLPWALQYAQAGYVAVVPDLRSQGSSGDAPVGYGPREAADVVDLARQLRESGQLPGPLFVVGASYGATVALFAASGLPQLRGVIALEPYANAADTIRRAPASGLFGHRWLARLITPREIDAAIALASASLGVDLAAIDAGEAVASTHVCTLIVRGADDRLMTADALRAMSERSPRARYVEVPGENHLSLPASIDRLLRPSIGWMQGIPADSTQACPGFVPLPAAADEPVAGQPATASPAAGS